MHFIASHPSTLQCPSSCTRFINKVSNSYYSLDYTSPCLSPKHFNQLKGGFWSTRNLPFWENMILSEYHPGNTSYPNFKSTLTTKTNNFGFWWYSSYLPLILKSSLSTKNENTNTNQKLNSTPIIQNSLYVLFFFKTQILMLHYFQPLPTCCSSTISDKKYWKI